MITHKECADKYGEPEKEKNMVLWDIPTELELGIFPNKIYCNKDLISPLSKAIASIKKAGLVSELKTWDGCFNIRKKRAGSTPSLHSWGVAIDINASWNAMGKPPTLSKPFVQCFKDAGFDWGGDWKTSDGMHFQLASI